MENNFLLCPKCKGILNVEENVVFSAKNKDGKAGLIFLHAHLGNYTVLRNPQFTFESGEQLTFYCPLCNTKLRSDKHKNLAQILMTDKMDILYHVYFSEIADEKSTYVLIGDNVEIYGQDSKNYIDFFNLSQSF
ncbi:MAG: hypothetical protein GXO79_06065 [Chlorobi bacterium]|nr:hypothetical protein [Chlorobiota bacterium]